MNSLTYRKTLRVSLKFCQVSTVFMHRSLILFLLLFSSLNGFSNFRAIYGGEEVSKLRVINLTPRVPGGRSVVVRKTNTVSPPESNTHRLAAQVADSIVWIRGYGRSFDGKVFIASGSGSYIGKGLILTAYHVIEDSQKARMKTYATFRQGDRKPIEMTLIGADTKSDVALMRLTRIPSPEPRQLDLIKETPQAGSSVLMIGYPLGRGIHYKTGRLNRGVVGQESWLTTSAMAVDGYSGGPLIDMRTGAIIGPVWGISKRDRYSYLSNPYRTRSVISPTQYVCQGGVCRIGGYGGGGAVLVPGGSRPPVSPPVNPIPPTGSTGNNNCRDLFDLINSRFGKIDSTLESMLNKVNEMEKAYVNLNTRQGDLEIKVMNIERILNSAELKDYGPELADIKSRLLALEDKEYKFKVQLVRDGKLVTEGWVNADDGLLRINLDSIDVAAPEK